MKFITLNFTLLLSIFCCAQKELGTIYNSGIVRLAFDTVQKKFSIISRNDRGYITFSDGKYINNGRTIYLMSNHLDSGITYTSRIEPDKQLVRLTCVNCDNRFPIWVEDNFGKKLEFDGVSWIYPLKNTNDLTELCIKVGFPKQGEFSCYKIYDYLTRKITLSPEGMQQKGLSMHFAINYNYFIWTPHCDTMKVSKHKITSLKSKNIYIEDRHRITQIDSNYFNRCIMRL